MRLVEMSKAAKESGIAVNRYKILSVCPMWHVGCFNRCFTLSRLGSAHPTGGDGYFLNAYEWFS